MKRVKGFVAVLRDLCELIWSLFYLGVFAALREFFPFFFRAFCGYSERKKKDRSGA
jgi:hypothetical protein